MTDIEIKPRHDLDGVERGKFVVVLRNHDRKHFKIFELPEGQSTEFDADCAERKWLHPELGLDHHLVDFFEVGRYESADDLISIQQNSIEYLNREVTKAATEIETLRAALKETRKAVIEECAAYHDERSAATINNENGLLLRGFHRCAAEHIRALGEP